MNKKLLVVVLAVAFGLALSVSTLSATTGIYTPPRDGNVTVIPIPTAKGVTCEVICNGECPIPPEGWSLSENTGSSGGEESDRAAGRCAYNPFGNSGALGGYS